MVGFPFFWNGCRTAALSFRTGPDGWVSSSWKAGHLCFSDNRGAGRLNPASVLGGQLVCVLPRLLQGGGVTRGGPPGSSAPQGKHSRVRQSAPQDNNSPERTPLFWVWEQHCSQSP